MPPPRLLGPYDPVLLGWTSREPILGPHTGIVTVNGLFRPFALVGGRAVATWRMAQGEVALEPFGRITAAGMPRRWRPMRADAHLVVRPSTSRP